MAINLDGASHCSKFAIPAMRRSGGGSIINMASVASFVGFEADAAHCASKGGLLTLTLQTAWDYSRKNIRVNAICPGFIRTPDMEHYLGQKPDPEAARAQVVAHHPIGRIGEPEEVASVAVFLASDMSSFVTGAHIASDGSLVVRPQRALCARLRWIGLWPEKKGGNIAARQPATMILHVDNGSSGRVVVRPHSTRSAVRAEPMISVDTAG